MVAGGSSGPLLEALLDVEKTVDGLTERGVQFERYPGAETETDDKDVFRGEGPKGVFRGEGPLIAWFKDAAGNVLSVIAAD